MKYLIDTDFLIDHLRGKKILAESIFEDGVAISIITLAELIYGAHKSYNPKESLIKLRKSLEWMTLDVKNLNESIISEFAKLKADLEKKGIRLEDFDLLIAATAKINNLILLTKNKRHFKRIQGLKLSD